MDKTHYKHPNTLWVMSACYSLFMAGFGVILASLTLYQTQQLHMSTDTAYGVFSAAMALLFILPLGGGYLAAKLGYMNSSLLGMLLTTFGMACFCLNSLDGFYLGLALFVVGNAVVTPAIWCIVDFGYNKESHLREAGFTLFYLLFNLGAVIGIFLGGYLANLYGFRVEFILSTVCLFLALLLLLAFKNKVMAYEGRSIEPHVQWGKFKVYVSLCLVALIATPVSILLFNNVNVNNILMFALLAGMIGLLIYKALKQPTKLARNKLIAFTCLSSISIVFWTLYSLEPSFLSVFVQNNADHHFLGINIPAASFFAFDGVFVILLGLVISRVWFYLSVRNKNPSLVVKFLLSLIIIGLGFVFLAVAIHLNGNQPLPARYIVIAYAIFSLAELFVGPLGISMVGRLAPHGLEGLMMGFWQLSTGIGGVVAGYIAMAPKLPDQTLPLAQSNPVYIKVFFLVGLGAIVAGLVLAVFAPKISKLMHEPAQVVPQL